MLKSKNILVIILIIFSIPSVYGEDADSVLNENGKGLGHYKKDEDGIVIYDRQWNRKGYLKDSGKDWERGSIFDSNNRRLGHF